MPSKLIPSFPNHPNSCQKGYFPHNLSYRGANKGLPSFKMTGDRRWDNPAITEPIQNGRPNMVRYTTSEKEMMVYKFFLQAQRARVHNDHLPSPQIVHFENATSLPQSANQPKSKTRGGSLNFQVPKASKGART